MTPVNPALPRVFHGVMVSSTFVDLVSHRKAVEQAIERHDLKAITMERDSAKADGDVLDSSLRMVRDCAAYVAVIGRSYGQVPTCERRNPDGLSLTELEFNEALRLERPILLFIMGDEHAVKARHYEKISGHLKKLDAFRERAKLEKPDSRVHRVYAVFQSLREFKKLAQTAISDLRVFLDKRRRKRPRPPPPARADMQIPKAPAFYAEPPYIGSHAFVGRTDQLGTLDEWASASDSYSILLFEAIGGSGKSMLTWEWVNKHAPKLRTDWGGIFWYSFYEKGAVMADFARRALAYTTGQPLRNFLSTNMVQLAKQLVHELRQRPWLLVLDGLERVLASYHRFDAAQMRDERAGEGDEIIKGRDPASAIRTEDDDLLRALAGVAPSKLLLTTRLTPRALLNSSQQAIQGVRRELLPGLRPAHAEELLRSTGVRGDKRQIQDYLKTHCDCHPLTTGAIAGLINNYLPARGDFDAWVVANDGGARLNLAELGLVQKRNHILQAAIDDLPEAGRRLLSMLALLPSAADYETLRALPTHLLTAPTPSKTKKGPKPSGEAGTKARLNAVVTDLEARGLLQYDHRARRYDLHPVVRGVLAGKLTGDERESYGQPVFDHFSQRAHDPWEQATTLDDLHIGLTLVRLLIQMGRYQDAFDTYSGDLADALKDQFGAHNEVLSLLRPLFNNGFGSLPSCVNPETAPDVAQEFAGALYSYGHATESLALMELVIWHSLEVEDWIALANRLGNAAKALDMQNRIAAAVRVITQSLRLAESIPSKLDVFRRNIDLLSMATQLGNWADADNAWRVIAQLGCDWEPSHYSPGHAEIRYAIYRLRRGDLQEEMVAKVEKLASTTRTRLNVVNCHELRTHWHFQRGEWLQATDHLRELIRMSREVGDDPTGWESQLLFAQFKTGQLENPRRDVELMSSREDADSLLMGRLWLALGEPERAKTHAREEYEFAWADGEPYVQRHRLNEALALFEELGESPPDLPPYDPARDPPFAWEEAVERVIESLGAKEEHQS